MQKGETGYEFTVNLYRICQLSLGPLVYDSISSNALLPLFDRKSGRRMSLINMISPAVDSVSKFKYLQVCKPYEYMIVG